MANLITVDATETLVKGTYQSDKHNYKLQYSYSDNKIKSMRIEITNKTNGTFVGSANFTDSNNSVVVNDQALLAEITGIVMNIYKEAVAAIAPPAKTEAPTTPTEPVKN